MLIRKITKNLTYLRNIDIFYLLKRLSLFLKILNKGKGGIKSEVSKSLSKKVFFVFQGKKDGKSDSKGSIKRVAGANK